MRFDKVVAVGHGMNDNSTVKLSVQKRNTYKERHLRIHDEQQAWGSGIFVLQFRPKRMLGAVELSLLRRGRTD